MAEERGIINQSTPEERLNNLENLVNSIKNAIIHQNEVILMLSEKVMAGLAKKEEDKDSFFVSTGNQGVNQSINNQSTITKHNRGESTRNPIMPEEIGGSTGNQGVQEALALVNQPIKGTEGQLFSKKEPQIDNFQGFKEFKDELNSRFKRLSRQELKTFLAIYQLNDEETTPTYKEIANKMDLSEHCIRAHVCSLFKKGAPLEKSRLNNRLTLIFVKKDFKMLNLKDKVLDLYYKTDVNQTTLFDAS